MEKRGLKILGTWEIFLLVMGIVASGYLIGEIFDSLGVEASEIENHLGCCQKLNDGSVCQNVWNSESQKVCEEGMFNGEVICEEYSSCKSGCCYDPNQGVCSSSTPKYLCEDGGGNWNEGSCSGVEECEKVCCIIGDQTNFVTERVCEIMADLSSMSLGNGVEIRRDIGEIMCMVEGASQNIGSCVLGEGEGVGCSLRSERECIELGGNWNENLLCSERIEKCKKQEYIGCVEGKDEIYWFDSCGNRENIYSSDKEGSYNGGRFLAKENSCDNGARDGNSDSRDCGNCNYMEGSICSRTEEGGGVRDGDYICKAMDCVDKDGRIRKNGESWCEYESAIGVHDSPFGFDRFAADAVGSRHLKKVCLDGEVVIDGCADYRAQVCVETEIEDRGQKYGIANCRVNNAIGCFEHNNPEGYESVSDEEGLERKAREVKKLCDEDIDCFLKGVDIPDTSYKFSICAPKYPRGFDLMDENGQNLGQSICGMASMEGEKACTAVLVKKWGVFSDWKCKANCGCLEPTFSQQLNDLCVSLGDCGSYINYIGEEGSNKRMEIKEYKEFSNYKGNVVGGFEEGGLLILPPGQERDSEALWGLIAQISGGAGTVISAINHLTETTILTMSSLPGLGATNAVGPMGVPIGPIGPELIESSNGGVLNSLGGFGNALGGISLGWTVGSFIAGAFGLSEDMAMYVGLATGALGGTLAMMGVGTASAPGIMAAIVAFSTLFLFLVIFAVLLAAIISLLGFGETKEVKVEFKCEPWQPPIGGGDCDKCGVGYECTEYKCESLGASCEYLNPNTDNASCIEIHSDDNSAPNITPKEIIDGYEFYEENQEGVKIRRNDGECMEEFLNMNLVLETDEVARCYYSFERPESFEDLKLNGKSGGIFGRNHLVHRSIPSLDSSEVYGLEEGIIDERGRIRIYVRCEDVRGNFNTRDYLIEGCVKEGPDLTAPRINKFVPESESSLSVGTERVRLDVYVNEPAECRYGEENIAFENMNEMTCDFRIGSGGIFGWPCFVELNNLTAGENIFYVKCRDQPWLDSTIPLAQLGADNETVERLRNEGRNRNTNSGEEYKLIVTENNLKIISILPEGVITSGENPTKIEVEVETEGGVRNGESRCHYKTSSMNRFEAFYSIEYTRNHKQELNFAEGRHNVSLMCEDIIGNKAEETLQFELYVDNDEPIVVRAYNKGGDLILKTNEESKCYYDAKYIGCDFDIMGNDSVSMDSMFETTHRTIWKKDKAHYIKCEDEFGNINKNCAIVVVPK